MPFLPDFLSRAGNHKHGIHREESKVQLMLAIARVFAMQSKSKDGASWPDVVRKVESMKPHHAGKCSELGEYVKHRREVMARRCYANWMSSQSASMNEEKFTSVRLDWWQRHIW